MQTAPSIRTDVLGHLRYLAADIGPRPAGSAANRAAGVYIASVFRNAGLDVEEQTVEYPDWQVNATNLRLGEETLTAVANRFSPSADVSGPTVALCSVAELERAELAGKIAVLYGNLTSDQLIALNYTIYNPEHDQHINQLLRARQPAAILTVSAKPGNLDDRIADWDLNIPSATVSAEAGRTLLQHTGQMAHLRIEATSKPGTTGNVVARKPGTRASKLVLCAHYDTRAGAPGACDNGSGVAILLALAERFAAAPLSATLEFVAFTDEEYYGWADGLYIERAGDSFWDTIAAINVDGVGPWLSTTTATAMVHSPALQAVVDETLALTPGMIWTEPWPQSNHSTFAFRGIPAIALTSSPLPFNLHQADDTLDGINPAKLDEAVGFIARLVEALHDKPTEWARAPQPE